MILIEYFGIGAGLCIIGIILYGFCMLIGGTIQHEKDGRTAGATIAVALSAVMGLIIIVGIYTLMGITVK